MNPTRQQLLEQLKVSGISAGDTHTADTITDVLTSTLSKYGEPTDEIADADELRDNLYEQCDSATPIYNHDLLEWLVDNCSALEDYQSNFGNIGEIIEKEGLPRAIMYAYCASLETDAMDALSSLYDTTNELVNC